MENVSCNAKILETLATKSSTKQLVYRQTQGAFSDLKHMLATVANELNSHICDLDKSVVVAYEDHGEHEARIRFSGDVLVFHMHTNAYLIDEKHEIRRSSYIKEDASRAFFGMIHIYNFLSDSLKYNRLNDIGHLVGRIFINKDKHFFVEGKRQLSFLYRDLANEKLDNSMLRSLVENAILLALNFDLSVPPFQNIQEINVFQMLNISQEMKVRKRSELGFKFSQQNL